MSQENVEIVRSLYEAWQRDGFGVVPELMDPDIEWVNPPYAVEPGTRHGYDEFAAAAQAVLNVYGDYRVSAIQAYDTGDRVAVRARVAARSKGNDIPIDAERGYVFDLRNGKVIRFAWFNNPVEALEAAGLEE
ncbi:MAG TPA: nuclear transport factor 2 family protein [Gemmatimonadales bacterium]|nr:nuclear transport factor 2 family protein [Gemmatimonadales bacterium]